jgi:nucleoside phosphorylase
MYPPQELTPQIPGHGLIIACPMHKEAVAIEAMLGRGAQVLGTGIGVKRSIPVLLKVFKHKKPSMLVFSGSVSQLDPSLDFGSVVVPKAWCFENGRSVSTAPLPGEIGQQAGWTEVERGLTVNRPAIKAAHRKRLFEEHKASIFDSVTATVVRLCLAEGILCMTPKIVANTVDSGLTRFWRNLESNLGPLVEGLEELWESDNRE